MFRSILTRVLFLFSPNSRFVIIPVNMDHTGIAAHRQPSTYFWSRPPPGSKGTATGDRGEPTGNCSDRELQRPGTGTATGDSEATGEERPEERPGTGSDRRSDRGQGATGDGSDRGQGTLMFPDGEGRAGRIAELSTAGPRFAGHLDVSKFKTIRVVTSRVATT